MKSAPGKGFAVNALLFICAAENYPHAFFRQSMKHPSTDPLIFLLSWLPQVRSEILKNELVSKLRSSGKFFTFYPDSCITDRSFIGSSSF